MVVDVFFVFHFGFVVSIFEVCNHFFNVVDMVIKTINILYFFSILRSKSKFSFSNGTDRYKFSHF